VTTGITMFFAVVATPLVAWPPLAAASRGLDSDALRERDEPRALDDLRALDDPRALDLRALDDDRELDGLRALVARLDEPPDDCLLEAERFVAAAIFVSPSTQTDAVRRIPTQASITHGSQPRPDGRLRP
jgi:hypothetical protein